MFRISGFCRVATARSARALRVRIRQVVACAVYASVIATFSTQASAADQAAAPPTASSAVAAQPAPATALAPGSSIQIAKSALLTIEGTPTADTLDLRIHKLSDQSLVANDDVTVTVDGRNEAVTRVNVDTYQIPVSDLHGDGAHEIEITVPHDGIREILSGKVTLPETSSAGGLLRDHKQVAWWILNIVIVLVAAIAISRRKG
jgi:hypothetical protein